MTTWCPRCRQAGRGFVPLAWHTAEHGCPAAADSTDRPAGTQAGVEAVRVSARSRLLASDVEVHRTPSRGVPDSIGDAGRSDIPRRYCVDHPSRVSATELTRHIVELGLDGFDMDSAGLPERLGEALAEKLNQLDHDIDASPRAIGTPVPLS